MADHKTENTTRMYFINVNGLQFGPQGGDFLDACGTIHTVHIDILGLAETKLDTVQRLHAGSSSFLLSTVPTTNQEAQHSLQPEASPDALLPPSRIRWGDGALSHSLEHKLRS
jgi:hypothetical protein